MWCVCAGDVLVSASVAMFKLLKFKHLKFWHIFTAAGTAPVIHDASLCVMVTINSSDDLITTQEGMFVDYEYTCTWTPWWSCNLI